MKCHAIRFELEKIVHHCNARVSREVVHAIVVELGEPDLLEEVLGLLRLEVLHLAHNSPSILGFLAGLELLVEEFAEIHTNRVIDEHLLIQLSVVVAIDNLCVLKIGEVSKGVGSLQQNLEFLLVLDTLDDSDDIVDLIAVKDALEEPSEWLGALQHHVFDLSDQLDLA